ncbi:uncharacterized protein [Triticum aestivum]|uniref:uncharacterized protein n=1 Tax=Triticum aestivum TaxID=4565 RepID=UPI001D03298E|nr:uncharacterized protein LOC123072743 [Triticum aestivum]
MAPRLPRSHERLNLHSMMWICTRRPPPSMAPPLLGHGVVPSPFWISPCDTNACPPPAPWPCSDHAAIDATVENPPQLEQFTGVMEEALSSCIANMRNIIRARSSDSLDVHPGQE